MRKRMGGIAIFTAATFLVFNSSPAQKKEMVQDISPQVRENQVSNVAGEPIVLPTNQVPITLVGIIDGDLTLEFEQGNKRDTYGRLLAYVNADGESIQGTLLKEGYARVAYIINPPYKYLEAFRGNESIAINGKINIWSKMIFVTNWGFNGCLP